MRVRGTSVKGYQFVCSMKDAVWRRGRIVAGYDPAKFRQDACQSWMRYTDYGDTNSLYGWEIDHILAVARGGSDSLWNLQPLQWENNRQKGDGPLVCKVTSLRNHNVEV